jgi:choloylglycine hydrolase
LLSSATFHAPEACTRAVYKGEDGLVMTGRSMDFRDDIPANLWVLPRGISRDGRVGPNSLKWTSKYGSLVATSFDIASVDGMNEKGLVGNMLWLTVSKYPELDGRRPGMAVSIWLQYMLDNFASVKEAVEAVSKEEFVVVSSVIPGTDKFTTVHLSLSDATGDNAILEYIDGKLTIHHDPSYTVMTNEPSFDQQLAINEYWKSVDGRAMLPGTSRGSDRFARASYYLSILPKTSDPQLAVAKTFSVIRNCSVPIGVNTGAVNISTTQWRTVADHKNLRYYFESAQSPNVIWTDLQKLDFRVGAPVRKLDVGHRYAFSGDVSDRYQTAKPFEFAALPGTN